MMMKIVIIMSKEVKYFKDTIVVVICYTIYQNRSRTKSEDMYTEKPSDRFMKIKTADPFSGGKKHKTNFGYVYSAGGVPCRINHGTVTHKIHWDKSPQGNID